MQMCYSHVAQPYLCHRGKICTDVDTSVSFLRSNHGMKLSVSNYKICPTLTLLCQRYLHNLPHLNQNLKPSVPYKIISDVIDVRK